MASDTTGSVGCNNFESETWDAVNRYLIEQKEIPSARELKPYLRDSLKEVKIPGEVLTDEKLEALSQNFAELFEILLSEAPHAAQVRDATSLLGLLSALELGDHTTAVKVRLQSRVQSQFAKIQRQVTALGIQCPHPEPTPEPQPQPQPPEEQERANATPLPVYGARFTLATAYQSCQALAEPVLDENTPEIAPEAVRITGTHPDGVGSRRMIGDLRSLLSSHPYYKNIHAYEPQCLRGSSYPLIYDYGGKPYATTGSQSPLNLFRDAGGGTSVLGTDCSGFIYTGLATAGLRLSPNRNMKASGVNGISAAMYLEPQKNGMSCLAKITLTPTSTLQAGDIVAVPGHVLMIDSVGEDPFGIKDVKGVEECANVESKNFDFVVIQSSSNKNAVGINRYVAKDYLTTSEKMKAGLEKYAYYACLAKVKHQNQSPDLGTLSVIRHKLTASCRGTRIKLAQEACVQSCPLLKR